MFPDSVAEPDVFMENCQCLFQKLFLQFCNAGCLLLLQMFQAAVQRPGEIDGGGARGIEAGGLFPQLVQEFSGIIRADMPSGSGECESGGASDCRGAAHGECFDCIASFFNAVHAQIDQFSGEFPLIYDPEFSTG